MAAFFPLTVEKIEPKKHLKAKNYVDPIRFVLASMIISCGSGLRKLMAVGFHHGLMMN